MSAILLFIMICLVLKGGDCESTEVLAEVGSLAILPCKWIPQTLSPAVTWSNSKGSIWRMQKSGLRYWNLGWASRVQCPHSHFENGDYSLLIKSVREEDAGLYSCTLSLENSRKPVKTSIMLRVIKVSFLPMTPIFGQSVVISCSVSPWPSGATVQWTLNNSQFKRSSSDNNTALIKMATDDLRGNWTCVLSYKGSEGRGSALLDLKGIAEPPNDNTKIYASVGSAVRLPCVFSNGLITSNVLWEKIHNISTSSPAVGQLPSSFSPPLPHMSTWDKSAGLNEVSFEDAGWYRCSATVEGQRIDRSMQLVTSKVDVNILSKKEATIKLTCQLSDTSNITEYEWLYVTSDLNGTQFIATVQKDKTVTLSQQSEGKWICRFYGKQGPLGNVTYYIQHMEGLSAEKSGGVSHDAAVLVGLSLLLLILLLILAQMYKNHLRRKKAFQYPALETIIHNISVEREMTERNQATK